MQRQFFTVVVLLSLCEVGCEPSQPAPPALAPLATPLPGPPQPRVLPERIDERLAFVDNDGNEIHEVTCGDEVTIQYRYRLPQKWTEAPGRALCSDQTSRITFRLETVHNGNLAIGGQSSAGTPIKTKTGEYQLTTTLKLPRKPGKEKWFLRARVDQTEGLGPLSLCVIPVNLKRNAEASKVSE
ncbi:MAG: hypothetical protein DWH91_12625 [Planctomycetota bacterium]|nr:MAG: hypothetical protein DWH91_12625 [Planctomycetota bacterium]